MNLVHAVPQTVVLPDPRSLQALLGVLTFTVALLVALYVALLARPAVEGFFAAMNAGTMTIFGGVTR